VCFGENSFNAHHVPRPRKLRRDDLVLIDFGAKFEGYASDMTRTFVFGEPNSKVEKVWSAVFEAQRSAMEKICSGVCCGLPDETARRVLNEKGLLDYYVHTLGHGVGLNVHEPPRLIIGSDERLEEGYVVTVEPGVYIKKWGGVRIEDTVVVRRRGREVLTEKLGKFIRFKDM
jgi:Xaa-Pro aminopeptidase